MSDLAPSLPPPVAPPTWRDRLESAATALGIDLRWAVGAAAVVAVAVLAFVTWRSSGAPADIDLPRATPAAAPTLDKAETEAATAHAAGAVARAGVYKLPPGARVTDLLDAAGGPTADAELDQLNLAARVADGERVYVPRRGEALPPAAGAPPGIGGPVDLNTATAEQLDALPGIGPATAEAILEHRKQNGRFRTVDDLLDVRGIGDAKLAELRDKVKV